MIDPEPVVYYKSVISAGDGSHIGNLNPFETSVLGAECNLDIQLCKDQSNSLFESGYDLLFRKYFDAAILESGEFRCKKIVKDAIRLCWPKGAIIFFNLEIDYPRVGLFIAGEVSKQLIDTVILQKPPMYRARAGTVNVIEKNIAVANQLLSDLFYLGVSSD